MKIILTTLFLFKFFLCSAQSDPPNNKLFGDGIINITSNSKILPDLETDRDAETDNLLKTKFTSGTIYFSGEGFETTKKFNVTDRRLLRKELKRCKPGTVLILVDCVVKDDDGEINELFNQIINLN